jgi:hypothetical protein
MPDRSQGVLLILALLAVAAAQRDKTKTHRGLNFLVIERRQRQTGAQRRRDHASREARAASKAGADLELKTDADGKTSFDGIPYGKLRVQVLASGFQTFGEDYDVDRAKMDFTIKLKRPQGQYSIYERPPRREKGRQEGRQGRRPIPTPSRNRVCQLSSLRFAKISRHRWMLESFAAE